MSEGKIDMFHAKTGMTISRSVYDCGGRLLLPADFILTPKAIALLKLNEIETIYIKEVIDSSMLYSATHSERVEQIRKTSEFKAFDRAHQHSVEVVQQVLNQALTTNKKIEPTLLLTEMDKILSSNKNNIQVFDMLHCIRDYDDLTYVHCVNVALICNVIGKWLKYGVEEIEALTLAGLLHDTGKMMMPKEIITKPDKLTRQEYEVIKEHPAVGYQLLKDEKLDQRVKLAILQHHEKCDGSGYPHGLKNEEIDIFSKIVTIADIYDAMTADRVYRSGMCPFEAIELFEHEGFEKYDVNVLLVFLEHIVESYINKVVLLSDGREGKIIMINKDRLAKPVVQCDDRYIDLSEHPSLKIKAIL